MSKPTEKFTNKNPSIEPLSADLISAIQQNGLEIKELKPIGLAVYSADVREKLPASLIDLLEIAMAKRGFLVFKHQTELSPEGLLEASKWWGAKEIHSTHGVHPATPNGNRDIFRLSNERKHGILGVGPQWHNDGSFEAATFSHAAYHMVKAPEKGGGTHFAHQGGAFDVLPKQKQDYWQRLVSVNSASGVLHPLVHTHPISGKKHIWLHLGMTGAVIERLPEEGLSTEELKNKTAGPDSFRLLNSDEMRKLFLDYNDLLDASFDLNFGIKYQYDNGDLVFIDNWAVAHRASPEAHMPKEKQGLRIMDRVTIKSKRDLKPHFELPQYLNIFQKSPFSNDGVWKVGGIGFRWKDDIPMQN